MRAGGTPLRTVNEYYKDGSIPFVRIEDITNSKRYLCDTRLKISSLGLKNSAAWLVPRDSVLYSMYASFGEAVINKVRVATNQAIIAIIPSETCQLDFLYYCLQALKPRLYVFLRETTQKNLNAEIVKNLKIVYPSFDEQLRIAAVLSTVDDAIQKCDDIITKMLELKKGLMQQLLMRGIEHTQFKQTEIGEIPEEWDVSSLASIFTIIDCKHKTPAYTDMGYPVVRPGDVDFRHISFDTCKRTSYEEYLDHTSNYTPKRGDIVFSRNASYGAAAYVATDDKFVIGQDVVILTSDTSSTLFYYYVLNSHILAKQLERLSTGSTFKRIDLQHIRRLKVPFPPLMEQQEIASILSTIDEKTGTERQEKEALKSLKKGLMNDLLTGKVRVRVT
jgi:type I restriction enzyme S subunit